MESVKKWLSERYSKKNGIYVHYSPPKLVGVVTSAQLRQWARGGAEGRLERAVLAGQGRRLLAEAESLPLANHSHLPGLVAKCDALHAAVARGSLLELQELLESDYNRRKYVMCRDEAGVGLLHKAVFYDYMDMAEYLVKYYPQLVHQKDSEGRTALHYAAVCRDEAAAAALLQGAGAARGARDAAGRTPAYYRGPGRAHLALPTTDNAIADMARDNKNTTGLVIKRHNIRIWCHDCDMARLQRVVWEGHGSRLLSEVSNQPVVKRFLEAVPYIMNTIRDIHTSVVQNDLEGLMKHAGDPVPPQALSSRDPNNLTVMHKAAGLGHGGILKYIANRYPQGINDVDNDGRTPLHYAAAVRDEQHTYNTLVSLGADESAVDNKNKTPVYYINRSQEIDKNIFKTLPDAPRTPSSAYPSNWDWKLLDTELIVELNKKSRRRNLKASNENISTKDTNTNTTSESIDNRMRTMKGSSTHELINNLPDLDDSQQNKDEVDINKESEVEEKHDQEECKDQDEEKEDKSIENDDVNENKATNDEHNIEDDVEKGKDILSAEDTYDIETKEVINANEPIKHETDSQDSLEHPDESENTKSEKVDTEIEEKSIQEKDESSKIKEFDENKCSGDNGVAKEENVNIEDENVNIVQGDEITNNQKDNCEESQHICSTEEYDSNESHHDDTNVQEKEPRDDNERNSEGRNEINCNDEVNKSDDENIHNNDICVNEVDNDQIAADCGASLNEGNITNINEIHADNNINDNHQIAEDTFVKTNEAITTGGSEIHDIENNKEGNGQNTAKFTDTKTEGNNNDDHNEDDDDVKVQGENYPEHSDSNLKITADISEMGSAKRGNVTKGRSTQESLIEGLISGEAEQDSQDASITQRGDSVHGEVLVVDNEIDPEVTDLINNANMEMLATLVLNGEGSRLIGRLSRNSELQAFLDNVPTYMQKINKVHVAARDGNIRDLQAALDRRKFAIARDSISPNGATPLHVATIFGKTNIIKYLGGRFPETLSAVDFEGRTSLHYAAVLPDNGHYYNLLQQLGANSKDLDDNGKSAEEYLKNPSLLLFDHLLSDYGITEDAAKKMFSDKGPRQADNGHMDIPMFNTDEGRYLAKCKLPLKLCNQINTKMDTKEDMDVYVDNIFTALGDPLIKGLTEVANVKPKDPVAFLASFLQNFPEKERLEIGMQESNVVMAQEAVEIENDQPPPSPTAPPTPSEEVRSGTRTATRQHRPIDVVTVDPQPVISPDAPETAFSSANRDEHGQSMLHFAAARAHARNALFQLLQESDVSLGFRDELYRTARDISIQANVPENTAEIDKWVLHLAARGNTEKIMELLMGGYDHILDVTEDGVPITEVIDKRDDHNMTNLLASIPAFEESRESLHRAVRRGDLAAVEAALSGEGGRTLARSQNSFGRTALHIAVLAQHEDIVAYLSQNYPELLRVGDNLERTPLHYAMGVDKLESLSRVLIRAGAKRVLKDLKGRQPTYYFMNKSDILRLKEEEEVY